MMTDIDQLTAQVKQGRVLTEPIWNWQITPDEHEAIADAVAYGLRWLSSLDSAQKGQLSLLFLIWCAIDFRTKRSYGLGVAEFYMEHWNIDQPRWQSLIDRSEKALSRPAIFVNGRRSIRTRVLVEAGLPDQLLRNFSYSADVGEGSVYWSSLVRLWRRRDAAPSQLVRWRDQITETGWLASYPWAGQLGFGPYYYDLALDLLHEIESRSLHFLRKDLLESPSCLGIPQLRNESGSRLFLETILGDTEVEQVQWEPEASRILKSLPGGELQIVTRIRPRKVVDLTGLGVGSWLKCSLDVGGRSEPLCSYFRASGKLRPGGGGERLLTGEEAVTAILQEPDGHAVLGCSTVLLEELDDEGLWIFQKVQGEWILAEQPDGSFPLRVASPRELTGVEVSGLIGEGRSARWIHEFSSNDELVAAGLDLRFGASALPRLALRHPEQSIRAEWEGHSCRISRGWPRIFASRSHLQCSAHRDGPFESIPLLPPSEVEVRYFRVVQNGVEGPRQRVVVLPEGFHYHRTSQNVIRFDGCTASSEPQPDHHDFRWVSETGCWMGIKVGDELNYQWNGVALRFPGWANGVNWTGAVAVGAAFDAHLAQLSRLELRWSVSFNPVTLLLVAELEGREGRLASIRFENHFVSTDPSQSEGRFSLEAMGNEAIRAMFSMTNQLDAEVRVFGTLSGPGQAPISIPVLRIRRFLQEEASTHFLFNLLEPSLVHSAAEEGTSGLWLRIPSDPTLLQWDGEHRPSFGWSHHPDHLGSKLQQALIEQDESISRQKLFQIFLEHHRGQDSFDENDWQFLVDSFDAPRRWQIPISSLRLPQVILHDDRILLGVLCRSPLAHKWIAKNRRIGFDWRLLRVGVVDGLSEVRFRESVWKCVHEAQSGEQDILDLNFLPWIANPLSPIDDESFEERWESLRMHGVCQDVADREWGDRQTDLDMLGFRSQDGSEFDFIQSSFDAWTGYTHAWNRSHSVPRWIEATLWLGWFSCHATDEQYHEYHGDALRFLRQLEMMDPQWVRDAFSLAQARALSSSSSDFGRNDSRA